MTEIDEPKLSVTKEGVANVFKTIKTNVKKSDSRSKNVEDHMTRKVEVDSHNPRNSTAESTLNTNTQQESCLKMTQLARSIARISLAKFGQKVSVPA